MASNRIPEARMPEARMPEARMPEARMPEARMPEARMPEARMPRVPHRRHSYMHQVYDSGEPPTNSLNRLLVVLPSPSHNRVCILEP